MSEPENQNEHPWGRHYAGKGRPRPPMMKLTSSGRLVVPAEKGEPATKPETRKPETPGAPPPKVPASVPAAASPKEPEKKINWHEMPEIEVVTAADLERVKIETEAKRRREMVGMFKIGGYCLLGVLVLALGLETIRFIFNRRPSEERLAEVGDAVATQAVQRFTSGEQPLEVDGVEIEETHAARGKVDYEFRVTMRLRAPLYAPADSNGAQPYLLMQRSLADAQALVLQQRLFLDDAVMATAPAMPALLAVSHRAGERRVVRVPVTASRTMWTWRLEPQMGRARIVGSEFLGQALSRYANTQYLIFGTKEARDAMRHAMTEARKFVLAVNAEHARRMRAGTE